MAAYHASVSSKIGHLDQEEHFRQVFCLNKFNLIYRPPSVRHPDTLYTSYLHNTTGKYVLCLEQNTITSRKLAISRSHSHSNTAWLEKKSLNSLPLPRPYHRLCPFQGGRKPNTNQTVSTRDIGEWICNTQGQWWNGKRVNRRTGMLTSIASSISQTLSTIPFSFSSATSCWTKLKSRKLMLPEWKNDRRGTPPSITGRSMCSNHSKSKLIRPKSHVTALSRPGSGIRWVLDMLPANAKEPLGLRYAGQCW